jgi:leucyl aminopeptidase
VGVKVLDERAMKQLGMGALLGVSRGSVEPARLIHLTYKPAARKSGAKQRARVALVGKGLTFDAGGISLKPSMKMWDMKYDMSGGAAVLGVFHALANGLDVDVEVHGVVPASENLPDAAASKPGDLSTAMNGTTIEVLNTDAEGRLILADALCYTASKIKPDTIIDLATLTGAVIVALGHELSGMFASTTELRDALSAAGEEVGEAVWPLPLFDFHKEQMKGEVADLRNINSPNHGNGSTSGAAFLSHFVGDVEWAHLDIAGTAWGARERDWVGGNQGTGVGVRLLMRYLQKR